MTPPERPSESAIARAVSRPPVEVPVVASHEGRPVPAGRPRVAPRRITTDLAEDLYAYLRRFLNFRSFTLSRSALG